MAAKRSVMVDDLKRCIVCGRKPAQIHHVFYGTSNRKNADEDGFIVPLCLEHHTGSRAAVHFNKVLDMALKQQAQRIYERKHTRQEFITRYGKSYL